MRINYTEEQIKKLHQELTREEFCEKLGLTSYRANLLIKQLGISKKRGRKPQVIEFKEVK